MSNFNPSEKPGVIVPEGLYTLKEFKARLGVSDSLLRKARNAGLKVRRIHGRGFILGCDFIDYIRTQASKSKSA